MSLPCSQYDLVVNIRSVHHEANLEAEVISENAPDDVCGDIIASMAQMSVIINRRTAGIPGDVLGMYGDESDFGSGQRIVYLQLGLVRRAWRLRPCRLGHPEGSVAKI